MIFGKLSESPIASAKVAIITRTRNRPYFLKRCIRSVQRQSSKNWIQVIVNDGGEPEQIDRIVTNQPEKFKKRLIAFHIPHSSGMATASNVGLRESRSEYVTLLDDDDTWHPDFLKACIGFLDNPCNALFGGVTTRSAAVVEVLLGDFIVPIYRNTYNPDLSTVDISHIYWRNRFTVNGFMYRRKCQERVGEYPVDFPVMEDWHFNLRFVKQFPIAIIQQDLANYHMRLSKNAPTSNTSVKTAAPINRQCTERIRREIVGAADVTNIIDTSYYKKNKLLKPIGILAGIFRNLEYIFEHGMY